MPGSSDIVTLGAKSLIDTVPQERIDHSLEKQSQPHRIYSLLQSLHDFVYLRTIRLDRYEESSHDYIVYLSR